jgi:hypothetical protein
VLLGESGRAATIAIAIAIAIAIIMPASVPMSVSMPRIRKDWTGEAQRRCAGEK